MKLFKRHFSIRTPEDWISIAALSLFALGTLLALWMVGPDVFSWGINELDTFSALMLGLTLTTGVGYIVAIGSLDGPEGHMEDCVTVEAQETMSETVGTRYLKI